MLMVVYSVAFLLSHGVPGDSLDADANRIGFPGVFHLLMVGVCVGVTAAFKGGVDSRCREIQNLTAIDFAHGIRGRWVVCWHFVSSQFEFLSC